jgi:hypothetical protein
MLKSLVAAAFMVCLLATGVSAQEAKSIPNLKGVWEGSSQMHFKEHGHVKPEGKVGKMEVSSQEGRVIHGTISWSHKKGTGNDTFSGVIDKDGVTFYLVGHAGGTRIGKLDGPDAFTLYILWPGGDKPRAGFAEFKRVK